FGADSAGALLEQLLGPLLLDFQESFTRGLLRLDPGPEAGLPEPQHPALRPRREDGGAGLAAARVLRQATPASTRGAAASDPGEAAAMAAGITTGR
ncbi:MAG: hypothetical protein ACKOPS_10205, partial [Cyanobium sp.]